MGQLNDLKYSVERVIAERGLDEYLVKGQISLKAGFMLSLVNERTPDSAEKSSKLREAVLDVLGARI